MSANSQFTAGLIFLILYSILFFALLYGLIGRYLSWRSRYTNLLLHIIIRLASQVAGIVVGVTGYSNSSVFVAFLILGAEGYFTLIICAYQFLIAWHHHNLASQDSWLEPRLPSNTPWCIRIRRSTSFLSLQENPMSGLHTVLVVANALIIYGASTLTGSHTNQDPKKLYQAKIYRAIGQSTFLIVCIIFLTILYATVEQSKSEQARRNPKRPTIHPTLGLLFIVCPLLMVRGVYGILCGFVPAFNFFQDNNGITEAFVVSEYLLSTTPEWITCTLLMLTYLTSRNDPPLMEWTQETVMVHPPPYRVLTTLPPAPIV